MFICFVLILSALQVHSFPSFGLFSRPVQIGEACWNPKASAFEDVEQYLDASPSRRRFITYVASGTPVLWVPSSNAYVLEKNRKIDCLSDLPHVPKDCVRLFLCRHGETENNRLKKIQGARVDPPINPTGYHQASRLGEALVRADPFPAILLHSPLKRSIETARVAAEEFTTQVQLKQLDSLAEVDFGKVAEGEPVENYRSAIIATYTAWASGDLEARMAGGGESGREVIERVESALEALVREATGSKATAVAAVTHSTYLRMLLATIEGISLLEASAIEQKNCCINVVDVSTSKYQTISGRSRLFGGPVSRAPSDFEIAVPQGQVLRLNEKRHLLDLQA